MKAQWRKKMVNAKTAVATMTGWLPVVTLEKQKNLIFVSGLLCNTQHRILSRKQRILIYFYYNEREVDKH